MKIINYAQVNVVDYSNVIMFISFVPINIICLVQLVETLISGHPQDPIKMCVTRAVFFQECFL